MIDKSGLYDPINRIALIVSCVALLVYMLLQRDELPFLWLRLGYEKTDGLRKKNGFLNALFSRFSWRIACAVLMVGALILTDLVGDVFPFLADNRYFTVNNYFALLYAVPIFLPLVFLALGADVRLAMDRLVPFMSLELGLGKIACFCTGCCYGVAWDKGLYNYSLQQYQVPVQLIEAGIGVLLASVFFYLLLVKKTDGRSYPLFMILYSGTRFMTEFLRGDHGPEWGFLRPFQVLCLIGAAIGAVWLVVVHLLKITGKRPFVGVSPFEILSARRKQK